MSTSSFQIGGRYLVYRKSIDQVMEITVEEITRAGNLRYRNRLTGSIGWFSRSQIESDLELLEQLAPPPSSVATPSRRRTITEDRT